MSESVPVQVFLGHRDRTLLERLTEQLDLTKSEVLRQGLAALERLMLNPETHPALRVVGLVSGGNADDETDAALQHDRILADSHEYGAVGNPGRRRGKA